MKKILYILMLTALFLAPVRIAHANDGTMHDRLIIGQNFTLADGEVVDGNLVVIAGETTIESGAVVEGDVVVIAGNLRLDGQALGSAVVIGGSAALGDESAVNSDLVALGGSFERAAGASIGGDIITNLTITTERLPRAAIGPDPTLPPPVDYRFGLGPLGVAVGIVFQAIALGVVGMLLSAFLRPQLDKVALVAQSQPFAAGSLGLLTLFLAPFAIVLIGVTIILLPVAVAAAFLLLLAWLFGVVALGQVVGERLMQALHRTWEPVVAVGVGAFALGIVLGTSNQIPCVGWMASLLVGLVGLGAVAITLVGARNQTRLAAPLADSASRAQSEPPPSAIP